MLKMDIDSSIDELEQRLVACEEAVTQVRRLQAELLHSLDARQIHRVDGARSLQEWVRGRLDVSAHTARNLVDAARQLPHHPDLATEPNGLSFERLVATSRLMWAGADEATVHRSFGFDLAGVDRLRSRHRTITRHSERDKFVDRYLHFQDSLDNTAGRINAELPGFEYTLFRDAIEERADAFGDLPGPVQTATQRRADALVAIAQDSREPIAVDGKSSLRSEPLTTVFVDATRQQPHCETNGEIQFGPRIGPAVLERLLCGGRVQLVGLSSGRPIVTSDASRDIPPEMRRFVAHRDGGCTIAGCHSRYRLQVHHIRFRADGGTHDPDNLTTLCWFHHHVVVHRLGFRIDPDSPPQKRSFLRNTASGSDPPIS